MNERQTGYVDARARLAALITARDALTRKRNALTHQIAYWRNIIKMDSLEESLRLSPDISPDVSLPERNEEKETREKNQKREENKEAKKEHIHTARARARKVFEIPSLADCEAYAREAALAIDVSHFFDHFTSNGWKVSGRTPMQDWRAAMRNWARRDKTLPARAQARKKDADEDPEQALERSRRKAINAIVKEFCHG